MNAGGLMQLVLRLIGGKPLAMVKGVTGERLPLTKALIGGGGFGGLLSSVAGGGLGSILSNPVGLVTSQLQGSIGAALQTVQAAASGELPGSFSSLTNALTAFQGSAGQFQSVTNLMSQFSGAAAGQFGLPDVMAHADAIAGLGNAVPAHLSLSTVLAPLGMGQQIATVAAQLPGVVEGVLDGSVPLETAVQTIASHTAMIEGTIAASRAALAAGQTLVDASSSLSLIASQLQAAPPDLQAVLRRMLAPEALAILEPPSTPSPNSPEAAT